jgi:transcription-repair coupling factor (superfamily II helicase)
VGNWLKAGLSVSILLKFERSGRYLEEKVLGGQESRWVNQVERHPGVVGMVLAPGSQQGGYKDVVAGEVLITEELIYGFQGGRRLKRLSGKQIHDAAQLSIGDFLIHPDHGVGCFLGLEPRRVVGVVRDYLNLQYAGEGHLYLPVEYLPLLRRHPGTTDNPPRLSTLGTNEWARAKERARVSAQLLASELIKTYAKRQVTDGVSYPAIPDWDPLIEGGFPFTLTPDQLSAVKATLADMERTVPMDRLVSGDVGFGKTEVAIRAAHRVLGHGKQVVMLVPTTVLARQHYETIRDRFKPLPVRVAMLSRFTSGKEARETGKGLKDGSVDVAIGTHRLLASDVTFRDLGLLIIDEEHRFGVGQKERLRSLRANLDVLSLSATPIPRTLYMSLVGLRDVSQILTPPEGRQPIQTVLQPYDALTVREAVLFEIERGGKVFYIHDRIGSIGLRARTLSQLIPEARIGVAHGQMDTNALEEVMLAFGDGAYDVLLSTTIVESGLDISGANTLVIERADRLGLAQLYQLRGRVGRRETEAWAYLLYPGRLTEQAQRRLYAIAELDDLGSGHLLAERDMEIRGVGNLLGPEQHGHVNSVSIVVYSELLAEEVAKLKGEKKPEQPPPVGLHVELDARLPATYISDDNDRIASYGRLAETDSLAEVNRISNDLRKRYGPFPPEVRAFIDLVKLRLLASGKGVVNIQEHTTDIQISFSSDQKDINYDARKLRELPYSVEPTRYPPGFSLKKRGLVLEKVPQALIEILYLCG